MAVMFSSGADMLVINPTLPQMAAELGVSVELGSMWVSSYSLATAAFALVFGPVSDRVGRRPILLSGLAILTLGTAACGVSGSFGALLAARFVSGVGAGMLVTSTTSYVGDHFDAQGRPVAMGWVMSGFFLSLILAVPIGAFLADRLGWQNMFFAIAGFCAVSWCTAALMIRAPRYEERTDRLSVRAAAVVYWGLMARPQTLGVLLYSLSVGVAMTQFSVYTAPWLQEQFGFTTLDRGLLYAAGGPAIFIGGPLSGLLTNRFGRVELVTAGSVVMAVMLLCMPATPLASSILAHAGGDWPTWGSVPLPAALPVAAVFFLAMCAGTTRAGPFMTLALEVVPSEQRGAMSALRNTFNNAGTSLGAATGAFVWSVTPAPFAYPSVCACAAATTILGLVLLRRLR